MNAKKQRREPAERLLLRGDHVEHWRGVRVCGRAGEMRESFAGPPVILLAEEQDPALVAELRRQAAPPTMRDYQRPMGPEEVKADTLARLARMVDNPTPGAHLGNVPQERQREGEAARERELRTRLKRRGVPARLAEEINASDKPVTNDAIRAVKSWMVAQRRAARPGGAALLLCGPRAGKSYAAARCLRLEEDDRAAWCDMVALEQAAPWLDGARDEAQLRKWRDAPALVIDGVGPLIRPKALQELEHLLVWGLDRQRRLIITSSLAPAKFFELFQQRPGVNPVWERWRDRQNLCEVAELDAWGQQLNIIETRAR